MNNHEEATRKRQHIKNVPSVTSLNKPEVITKKQSSSQQPTISQNNPSSTLLASALSKEKENTRNLHTQASQYHHRNYETNSVHPYHHEDPTCNSVNNRYNNPVIVKPSTANNFVGGNPGLVHQGGNSLLNFKNLGNLGKAVSTNNNNTHAQNSMLSVQPQKDTSNIPRSLHNKRPSALDDLVTRTDPNATNSTGISINVNICNLSGISSGMNGLSSNMLQTKKSTTPVHLQDQQMMNCKTQETERLNEDNIKRKSANEKTKINSNNIITSNRGASQQPQPKLKTQNNNNNNKQTYMPAVHTLTAVEEFQCDQVIDVPQQVKSARNTTTAAINNFSSDSKNSTLNQVSLKPQLKMINNPKIKDNKIEFEFEIAKFQKQQIEINLLFTNQSIQFLSAVEAEYAPDPNYIEKRQKNFAWHMRAILVDWMMHVNSEYRLKRDTFHLSVALADMYFNKVNHVPKNDLQLVGAAAMYVASKIEEPIPLSVKRFATSTSDKYTVDQILEMETKICKLLKWQLNPPTIFMWANKFMLQWDAFLEQDDYARSHPILQKCMEVPLFKKDGSSLRNFLQMTQYIDSCIMDIQSFQYKPKVLVCSFLYLVLGKQFQTFTTKQIVNEFPESSLYMMDEDNLFNDLFGRFVELTFGFLLFDILPTVQYCATYFGLPLQFSDVVIPADQQQPMNLEGYCSYQTYNTAALAAVKKRKRTL